MIQIHYYKSPLGVLILGDYQGKLCMADWQYRKMRNAIDQRIKNFFQTDFIEALSPLHQETIKQLEAYFQKERKTFNLPIVFAGTDFQVKVWEQLLQIPYGNTLSYLQLSKILGNEKTIRAVATANGANALSIIVPCHRVIGSNGELTGYAGGLTAKRKLLDIESRHPITTLFD